MSEIGVFGMSFDGMHLDIESDAKKQKTKTGIEPKWKYANIWLF